MRNDLQFLRLSHSLSAQELVDSIRPFAPKYDKPLNSKAENPDVYGVQLRPDILKAIYTKYDPEGWEKRKRRADGHRNQSRIYCRMDDVTYKRLLAQIHQDGFRTVQDWVMDQILAYINARSDDP